MEEPTYLAPLNQEAALKLGTEIDTLLGQISAHELRLAHSYARLGGLLREVELNQFWITFGYKKFSSYLEFVRSKIGRERSQVYAILSVAKVLLPLISEEKLEEIGITKAHELKRLVSQGGNVESEIDWDDPAKSVRLMDYAADPKVTAKQLRVKVNEILHIKEDPQGFWYDLNGFYALPDEKKEIEGFWELGRRVLEIASEQEHEWKKQVFLAAVRESISTWVVLERQDG